MAGYVWDGSNWRTINSAWAWAQGTAALPSWRQINSGWVWTGASTGWKQIFSSGTFNPEIRQTTTSNPISYRSVGLVLYGYRGSTAVGTYDYEWQYNYNENQSESGWTKQTGTNATGTLVSTNLTTTYTTDATDLNIINLYPYILWMRFKVTKSGETQYSQTVKITKREPSIRSGTNPSINGTRAVGSAKYDPTLKNPYPNDVLQHISSWTLTTTLSGDTRPDYYIYTWTTGSGVYAQDSRTFDVGDPSAPQNANKYTVKATDLLSPISVSVTAYTSNPTPTTPSVAQFTTRNVSDGILQAPTNLNLTLNSTGNLVGTWNASDGGTDGVSIFYNVSLEKDGVQIYTVSNTTATTFSYLAVDAGTYRFKVTATQSGSADKTSDYSNEYLLEPPKAFTYSIQNVTASDYPPGDFTIFAPTEDANTLNKYVWNWTSATGASKYGDYLISPSGSQTNEYFVGTNTTDFWNIVQSGNHTITVTAYNETKNYVRISWTKPAGTTAQSYKIIYSINSYYSSMPYYASSTVTVPAGDVSYIDITIDTPTFTTYFTGRTVSVVSVTAYSQPNQSGIPRTATVSGSNSSEVNATSKRTKTRTDSLTFSVVTAGTITINGLAEPNQILSWSANSDWTPAATSTGWTFTQQWYKTRVYPNDLPDITAGTTSTVTPTTSDVGEYYSVVVTGTYKSNTVTSNRPYSQQIVPGPPSFNLADSFSQSINVSSVSSAGGSFFYGTYDNGTSTLNIAETALTSFTLGPVSPGSRSVTLFGRAKKTITGSPTDIINGRRSTTNFISISDPPQATGQQRFVSCLSIFRGSALTVATNGYVGYRAGASPTGATIPSTGNYLNIAARDIVQTALYTYSNADGVWVRFQGYQYLASSKLIDYQVYFPWQSASAYVYFVRNDLDNYRANDANINFGTVATRYSDGSYSPQNLLSTSIMTLRSSTTAGSLDDGYTDFTPTAPGVAATFGASTPGSNSYTVPITNWNAGLDSSWTITFTVTPAIYSGTAVLNTSTGVVTVNVGGAGRTATLTAVTSKTGYDSSTSSTSGTSSSSVRGSFSPTVSISKTGTTSGTLTFNSTVTNFGTPTGTQNWDWTAPGYPSYKPNTQTYRFDSGDYNTTITAFSYLQAPNGEWTTVNSNSASIFIAAPVTAPGTPTGLSATYFGGTSYNFSWNAGSGGTPTSYNVRVYRATSRTGTGSTLLTTLSGVAQTSTSYTSPSASYYISFAVQAVNSAGSSTYSAIYQPYQ